jgi:hypothetical protein
MKTTALFLILTGGLLQACDSQEPKPAGEWPTKPTLQDIEVPSPKPERPRASRFSRLKYKRVVVQDAQGEQRTLLIPNAETEQ